MLSLYNRINQVEMIKYIPLTILAISLVACSSEESLKGNSGGEVVSSIAAGADTDTERRAKLERIQKEEEARLKAEAGNITSLTFDKVRHDFGDVEPESDNTTVFTVTNTGDRPLIINDVKASCGCTTPKNRLYPIAPGASDVIEVTFSPKPGQKNEIVKTVTVTANTEPKISTLTIRSFVKE